MAHLLNHDYCIIDICVTPFRMRWKLDSFVLSMRQALQTLELSWAGHWDEPGSTHKCPNKKEEKLVMKTNSFHQTGPPTRKTSDGRQVPPR